MRRAVQPFLVHERRVCFARSCSSSSSGRSSSSSSRIASRSGAPAALMHHDRVRPVIAVVHNSFTLRWKHALHHVFAALVQTPCLLVVVGVFSSRADVGHQAPHEGGHRVEIQRDREHVPETAKVRCPHRSDEGGGVRQKVQDRVTVVETMAHRWCSAYEAVDPRRHCCTMGGSHSRRRGGINGRRRACF